MGSNVYLNTDNHVRVIKAGLKVSDFVNESVEKELDRREQKDQEVC